MVQWKDVSVEQLVGCMIVSASYHQNIDEDWEDYTEDGPASGVSWHLLKTLCGLTFALCADYDGDVLLYLKDSER